MAQGAPLFSVIIAARNASRFLPETLESLLAQSFPDWEAIVVDDGSVDATAAVAGGFTERDSRIRLLRQAHGGVALARNAGVAVARAPWLLPLDSDDMLLPQALHEQSRFIAGNPGRLVYSWGVLLQEPDGSRRVWRTSAAHSNVEEFRLAQLIHENLLTIMTVVSTAWVRQLGGFRDCELEDYDLWLRAFAAGATHIHNPALLGVYRVSSVSRNADLDRRELGMASVLRHLSGSADVSPEMRRRALRRARYWEAVVGRRHLETRLRAGDESCARRDYWKYRVAYQPHKWAAGLLVAMLRPRLLARLVPARPTPTNLGD